MDELWQLLRTIFLDRAEHLQVVVEPSTPEPGRAWFDAFEAHVGFEGDDDWEFSGEGATPDEALHELIESLNQHLFAIFNRAQDFKVPREIFDEVLDQRRKNEAEASQGESTAKPIVANLGRLPMDTIVVVKHNPNLDEVCSPEENFNRANCSGRTGAICEVDDDFGVLRYKVRIYGHGLVVPYDAQEVSRHPRSSTETEHDQGEGSADPKGA